MTNKPDIMPKVHLFHSLLQDSLTDNIDFMVKGAMKHTDISKEEATEKCQFIVTGYSICMLSFLVPQKITDGELFWDKLLVAIGKSKNDVKVIKQACGATLKETEVNFKKECENYLGLPETDMVLALWHTKILSSMEALVELIAKQVSGKGTDKDTQKALNDFYAETQGKNSKSGTKGFIAENKWLLYVLGGFGLASMFRGGKWWESFLIFPFILLFLGGGFFLLGLLAMKVYGVSRDDAGGQYKLARIASYVLTAICGVMFLVEM